MDPKYTNVSLVEQVAAALLKSHTPLSKTSKPFNLLSLVGSDINWGGISALMILACGLSNLAAVALMFVLGIKLFPQAPISSVFLGIGLISLAGFVFLALTLWIYSRGVRAALSSSNEEATNLLPPELKEMAAPLIQELRKEEAEIINLFQTNAQGKADV